MGNLFIIIFVALVLGAGLSFAFLGTSHRGIDTTAEVIVNTATDARHFRVAVADDDHERAQGLMWIKRIDDDEGMLFVFDKEDLRTFWMKNTKVPLDMLFIDDDLRIVSVQESAMPCKADPCPTYPSAGPARYVLEIRGGLADEKNINAGDLVVIKQ